MTTFRQNAKKVFEKRFAVDEELKFKANARRQTGCSACGAAAKLGLLPAPKRTPTPRRVVVADFRGRAGEDDVFRKIRRDLDCQGRQGIRSADFAARWMN